LLCRPISRKVYNIINNVLFTSSWSHITNRADFTDRYQWNNAPQFIPAYLYWNIQKFRNLFYKFIGVIARFLRSIKFRQLRVFIRIDWEVYDDLIPIAIAYYRIIFFNVSLLYAIMVPYYVNQKKIIAYYILHFTILF
jgi:hypothetical protein